MSHVSTFLTALEVNIKNENYECSGVVSGKKKKGKNEEERPRRGYKLGSLRSLLDDEGIITAMDHSYGFWSRFMIWSYVENC